MDACYAAGVFTCLPVSLSLSLSLSVLTSISPSPLKGAVVPGSARETPAMRRPRSRDRKVEIFISNAACKVSGAPPLQVIFMGPPRSNELIFTFYAFIPRASTAWPRTARLESIPVHRFRDRGSRLNGRKIARLSPTTIIKTPPPLDIPIFFCDSLRGMEDFRETNFLKEKNVGERLEKVEDRIRA